MNPIEKMAESGGGDGIPPKKPDQREEKIRLLRERQAEERLRRLDDLKKQALEAQQLREQKEIERRKRMDELRVKENERRQQVEGRKKQIWEAERERREGILRKNQERDARMDAKRRNERSSIVFAFGSSTPRLLETSDSMVASYWGPRRATSTVNLRLFPATTTTTVTASAMPRRPSEREPDAKKRASSAGGLYRNPSDAMVTSMYEVLHWSSEPHTPSPKFSLPPTPSPNDCTLSPSTRSNADGDDGWSVGRVGRRKTDLMPTTPSPRDTSSRPGSGTRSLARTPGRAVSMARLDQLARPRAHLSRSTAQLTDPAPLRAAKSMVALGRPQPAIAPRTTRAERLRQRARAAATARSPTSEGFSSSGDVTPSRPGSVMSQSSVLSASTLNPRLRSAPRRPRPSSIHVTGVSKDKILSPSEEKPKPKENKVKETKVLPAKPVVTKKQIQQKNEEIKKSQQNKDEAKQSNLDNSSLDEVNLVKKENGKIKKKESVSVNGKDVDNKETTEEVGEKVVTPEKPVPVNENEDEKGKEHDLKTNHLVTASEAKTQPEETKSEDEGGLLVDLKNGPIIDPTPLLTSAPVVAQALVPVSVVPLSPTPVAPVLLPTVIAATTATEELTPAQTPNSDTDPIAEVSIKGNVMTRSRITTEEEAKAVLAERRRLAREQAEREAEAERQRLAKEAEEEEERLRKEEEEQRLAEEEQLRLIEEARKVEEQRLMLAIQEAEKREEEEKERRRLEEQARVEKEEADRLAREEAEKQRIEMVERLKKEEEERQARRKRVEAIMKRTRNTAPSNANKPDCEKGEEDGAEREKDESKGNIEAFLHGERLSADRSLTNGQSSNKPALSNINEDSHPNGLPTSGIANEDCVNSNSPLATPLIAFQGKTKETPLPADFLA